MVSRLVEQKGLDLIEAASDDARSTSDATWVFVGPGEPRYEAVPATARRAAIRRASACTSASTKRLAHLVEAGADMFLMPSKFEPCGLNQMYSLRYGTVPIVHAVGGLDDTIQPLHVAGPSRERIQVQRADARSARRASCARPCGCITIGRCGVADARTA